MFKNKFTFFDGYVGLQVHKDLEVKPVRQLNVVQLQHKLYKLRYSEVEQHRSICTILDYMKYNNKIVLQNLDWGNKYICDDDGKLIKR